MNRGPKPKHPNELQRYRRRNPDLHPIGNTPPTMPKGLSEAEKKVWRKVVSDLEPFGVLTAADSPTLQRYCNLSVRLAEAQTAVEKDGDYYRTSSGIIKKHPALQAILQIGAQLSTLESALGMTPAARVKLGVEAPAEEEDELEAFINSKQRFFRTPLDRYRLTSDPPPGRTPHPDKPTAQDGTEGGES